MNIYIFYTEQHFVDRALLFGIKLFDWWCLNVEGEVASSVGYGEPTFVVED